MNLQHLTSDDVFLAFFSPRLQLYCSTVVLIKNIIPSKNRLHYGNSRSYSECEQQSSEPTPTWIIVIKKKKKIQTRWNDRGETVKECSFSFPSGKKKQSVSSLYIEHDITQLDTVVLSCTRAEWSNSTTNSCSSWYLTVFEVLQNTCITLPSSSLYIYWYQIQVPVSVLPCISEKILTVVFLGTLIVIVKSHCCSLWQFKELHHSLRIHYLDSVAHASVTRAQW